MIGECFDIVVSGYARIRIFPVIIRKVNNICGATKLVLVDSTISNAVIKKLPLDVAYVGSF